MASRIGLGRIVGWAKEADMEELHYALHRLTAIAQERNARLQAADAHGKVKRTRRAGKQAAAVGQDGAPAGNVPAALREAAGA